MSAKARAMVFVLCSLFVCSIFPQVAHGQLLDEVTGPMSAMIKNLNVSPAMVAPLLQKAADGDAQAQYVVAWLYFTGQSVQQDHALAVQWMTKAANQDFKFVQTQLGLMYLS